MKKLLIQLFVMLAIIPAVFAQSSEVITLYGYLKVFPNDLGKFDSNPTTTISRINDSEQYGYCTWRIPNNEEISLMRASNLLQYGETYMSSDGSSYGIVRLVTDSPTCYEVKAQREAEAEQLRQQAEAFELEAQKIAKKERYLKHFGAINGVFSVSDSKKVYFSKGNLEYQASTNTFRFAPNQWHINGEGNAKISNNYDDWIDLFVWGSGNKPYSTDKTYSYYDYANNERMYLYNPDGDYCPYRWSELSNDEWDYVLTKRSTKCGKRYVKAEVVYQKGYILLPDNWDESYYYLRDDDFDSNRISSSDWVNKLEAKGAVFLPCAGYRPNYVFQNVGPGNVAYGDTFYKVYLTDPFPALKYWSSTICGSGKAYDFRGNCTEIDYGCSIRLVIDVNFVDQMVQYY